MPRVKVRAPESAHENQLLDFSSGWDYAPAPEATDHIQLNDRYQLFIGGRWVEPRSGKYFPTINPATEEQLAEVAEAGTEDVDRAVQAARHAYEKYWKKLSPRDRAKYIFRIARLLQERAREFAVIETLDNGKPIRETRDVDIPLSVAHFFYYAGWADKLKWAFPGREPRPVGVCGQIIPWNFPLLMAAWKIAPALACGNTVVLKPAETTPLTALKLAQLIQEADLPPGVVNIVTGGPTTGQAIVTHPNINKLAFTGSTEVGRIIYREAVRTAKKVTLELGGKSAFILTTDAALDQAIEGIVNAIFFNQGHVCCAGSRLLVQEPLYEQVLQLLKLRIETLRVGPPLDKNTDVGAINSKAQLDKILYYVALASKEGAQVYQAKCSLPEKGYWFAPTILYNCTQNMRVVQDEIFGPVLTVQTFRTLDEAIQLANNTYYGLSGGVWSSKGSRTLYLSQRVEAGVIWANTYNRFSPAVPFGGYKESGFGREGGWHGLLPYVEL